MSSSTPPFLRLPRELRDQIYEYYHQCHDGYSYNFESNKLTQANGKSVHLSLTLACRQIHSEVVGLALRLNAIVFETFFCKCIQRNAMLYHNASKYLADRKSSVLNRVAPLLLDTKMAKAAAKRYPQFKPMLRHWRNHSGLPLAIIDDRHWGEPPSIQDDFITYTLSLLSKNPKFVDMSHDKQTGFQSGIRPAETTKR